MGYRSIDRRMIITRLGEGVDRRRALSPEALRRTLATIADYAATCGELGVERLRVTGTSAVRDAVNRDEFFDGVRMLTGSEPEVLSGDAEARATFLGVLSDLDPAGPVVVIDIGGGSTEIVVGDKEPRALVSLDVGCVRMLEKHLHSDPPTKEEIGALRQEVSDAITRSLPALDIPPGARFVGVAGTVTQLATLKVGLPVYDPDVIHHTSLSHGDVRRLARRLGSLAFAPRKKLKGLEAGRVDVIVAGAYILLTAMEVLDAAEILVSEKDILDGLIIELLRR